ncbi:hypothetical protein JCM10212_002411, partial [Sporobolomyces blumeae]
MGAQQSTPSPPPATPPPGCPMHQPEPQQPPQPPPGCPMHSSTSETHNKPSTSSFDHAPRGQVNELNNIPDLAQAPSPGQKHHLPLERTISSIPRAPSSQAPGQSACPVNHGKSSDSSTTPTAADKTDQWEYPSPQQFYNALVRKGWETPEESVEMMVNIHNWLNEEAWAQVRKWEERFDG